MSEEVLARNEKKKAKLIARYTNTKDIKFRGPLSYRYLRIIAWITFAIGQLITLYSVFSRIGWTFLPNSNAVHITIYFISFLATPLFIVATFGVVLSGQKTLKSMIILYAGAYIALAVGLNIFFYRYLLGILQSHEAAYAAAFSLGFILKANVFGDLLAFCLFIFFMSYKPKKYFHGKKIIIFRLFSLLPVLFVFVSYLLKVLSSYDLISVPFAIVPFVATKPPMVMLIFALMALWIRHREHTFKQLGLTKTQYETYLKTNLNSLSFSVTLSVIIAIFGIIEIVISVILISCNELGLYHLNNLGIGETIPLIFIIPFIMLYSYTRGHKNKTLDLLIPIIGIGMSLVVYAEVIYHFFTQFVWG